MATKSCASTIHVCTLFLLMLCESMCISAYINAVPVSRVLDISALGCQLDKSCGSIHSQRFRRTITHQSLPTNAFRMNFANAIFGFFSWLSIDTENLSSRHCVVMSLNMIHNKLLNQIKLDAAEKQTEILAHFAVLSLRFRHSIAVAF